MELSDVESFLDKFRGRLGYFGSFVVAWCAFNWRYIYVTFFVDVAFLPVREGSTKFADKLEYFAYLASLDGASSRLFWWPVYAAFLAPLFVQFADGVVNFGRTTIKQGFGAADRYFWSTRYYSKAEYNEIASRYQKLQVELDQTAARLAALQSNNESLRTDLAEKTQAALESGDLKTRLEKSDKLLKERNDDVLLLIDEGRVKFQGISEGIESVIGLVHQSFAKAHLADELSKIGNLAREGRETHNQVFRKLGGQT